MVAHINDAGTKALGESAKKATPEGNVRTPDPIMDLAILNVVAATVVSPPLLLVSDVDMDEVEHFKEFKNRQ